MAERGDLEYIVISKINNTQTKEFEECVELNSLLSFDLSLIPREYELLFSGITHTHIHV